MKNIINKKWMILLACLYNIKKNNLSHKIKGFKLLSLNRDIAKQLNKFKINNHR